MILLIRAMCTLVVISLGVIGGLVSNNSDSEMRELNAQGAEFDLLAWAFSWSEPHVGKRKGQRSNRKLNGPEVESYIIWVVPALVISSCMGARCGIYV